MAIIKISTPVMAGKRLLDAAACFNASRGILSKYVTLQSHRFDAYSKTSSLAKAIKGQTDRVTLTLKAASALNQRFNGPGPQYSTQAQDPENEKSQEPTPRKHHAGGRQVQTEKKQGLEQDHFYTKSGENDVAQSPPNSKLNVKQERAKRNPLPDGSIPPEGTQLGRSVRDQDVSSKPQQAALEKDLLSDPKLDMRNELHPASSSESSIPRPIGRVSTLCSEKARELQRQAELQIPSQPAEPPARRVSDKQSLSSPDLSSSELGIDQERDVYYTPPSTSGPVLSSLPRVKLPKVVEDAQLSDEHVADAAINQDVFYSSNRRETNDALSTAQAVPEQDSPSEDTYSEIFHSPRVARLLSNKQRLSETPGGLKMQGLDNVSSTQIKLSTDKDQDTYSARASQQKSPDSHKDAEMPMTKATPDRGSDEEIRKLAGDLAKENQDSLRVESEVCSHRYYSQGINTD